jgi:hypothetical protein
MQQENYIIKPITEFTPDDTLYMVKTKSGYTNTFFLKFKSFSDGQVVGEVIDIQPNNIRSMWIGKELISIGSELSGPISKCYLYKKVTGCHWFEKQNGERVAKNK